jgi:hypothetical protein
MAPLQQELSRLEVEPLQIVSREGFHTPPQGFDTVRSQDRSLDTLTTLGNDELAALLTGNGIFTNATVCCCCCCPGCCCYL